MSIKGDMTSEFRDFIQKVCIIISGDLILKTLGEQNSPVILTLEYNHKTEVCIDIFDKSQAPHE